MRARQIQLTGLMLPLVAMGMTGAGCGEKKRTEIILGLATDLNAPIPLGSVNLQVFHLPVNVPVGQQDFTISGKTGEIYGLPGSYAVYSESGKPDRVQVVLTATDNNGQTLVRRTAVLTLVPQKTLFVRLGVVTACLGKLDCPKGDTCIEGRCGPEEIDTSRLPVYKPGMEQEIACSGGTAFVDTSTKQPLPLVSTSVGAAPCDQGTCQEGVCLAPVPGAFTPTTGPLAVARVASAQIGSRPVTLDDAKVLFVGGRGPNGVPVFASTEVYDPDRGTFATRGNMSVTRTYFGEAKLRDGRVLVMGGINETAAALASAEIYDAATGQFTLTAGSMTVARTFPAAVTLDDGRVLVVGGVNQIQSFVAGVVTYLGGLDSAEIYDPATNTFTALPGRLVEGRAFPVVAALPDGGAVVLCGEAQGGPRSTVEHFSRAIGTFGATPVATLPSGAGCTAADLGNGKLLVLSAASPAAWLFDAAVGTFTGAGTPPEPQAELAAVLLDGDVLFVGGAAGRRAYIFDVATRSFAYVAGDLGIMRSGFAGALLRNGDVLIAGGDPTGTAEVFHRPGGSPSPNAAGGGRGGGSATGGRGGSGGEGSGTGGRGGSGAGASPCNPVKPTVVNGNFEMGTSGFCTDYTFVVAPAQITTNGACTVAADPGKVRAVFTDWGGFVDHTSGSGNMLICDGALTAGQSLWTETVSAVAGTSYRFSFWVTVAVPSSVPTFQAFVNSMPVGNLLPASTTKGTWTQYMGVWPSGVSTTATLSIVDTNTAGGGNDFAVDDISFTAM